MLNVLARLFAFIDAARLRARGFLTEDGRVALNKEAALERSLSNINGIEVAMVDRLDEAVRGQKLIEAHILDRLGRLDARIDHLEMLLSRGALACIDCPLAQRREVS
jgi:hypothetical protein